MKRYFEKEVKVDLTKIVKADLDSPRPELSYGGLGIVVALSVFSAIEFLCVCTGGAIQLYTNSSTDQAQKIPILHQKLIVFQTTRMRRRDGIRQSK